MKLKFTIDNKPYEYDMVDNIDNINATGSSGTSGVDGSMGVNVIYGSVLINFGVLTGQSATTQTILLSGLTSSHKVTGQVQGQLPFACIQESWIDNNYLSIRITNLSYNTYNIGSMIYGYWCWV